MATIQDFGRKIGGAAKDRAAATPTGEKPAPRPRQRRPARFNCYMSRQGGAFWFERAGDKAKRRLIEFATSEAVNEFSRRPDRQTLLEAAWEAAKARGNITEDSVRGTVNRPRSGYDHRGGEDVSAEDFALTFCPYGVEFGNWQTDRQSALNLAYDALQDLGVVVGISPTGLFLGERLGLAFGARGHGKASAHYEPERRVINLTKTAGAGCLAHEWFHAWDNDQSGGGPDAYGLTGWLGALWTTLKGLPLYVRSVLADAPRSKPYWATEREVCARAFEAWVRSRVDNDYLANIRTAEEFAAAGRDAAAYPYPRADEMPAVDAAFRRLFSV